MSVSLAGKTALVTGASIFTPDPWHIVPCTCSKMDVCLVAFARFMQYCFLLAGSTQGIGFGMLKALAGAGADVVMHGLVAQDELDQKTKALKEEFGVKVGHSAANVRKPQEIR